MRVEVKEATAQDVVEGDLLDQRFMEVFLPHPENIPLVQVLTLHTIGESEASFCGWVIDTRSHESWTVMLPSEAPLITYPWGSY